MKSLSRDHRLSGHRAQAIVEFAIVLPILLMLMVGIFEVGRMIFIYAAVTNASREAVRYGSAVGLDTDPADGNNYQKYSYCKGIRSMAKRSAYFLNLPDGDIAVSYDRGPSTSTIATCTVSTGEDSTVKSNVLAGDRVVVQVTATYRPLLRLIPIGQRTITSRSARTILGVYNLEAQNSGIPSGGGPGGGSGGGGGGGSGPTSTATATSTSTVAAESATPTATSTATATGSGPWMTNTPFPTLTPSLTPTITLTPTETLTPTPTFTPTMTPTPKPGCDSLSHGSIVVADRFMSMAITNPHEDITVLNVQVKWNNLTGAPPAGTNGKPLDLVSARLGHVFWEGTDSSGNFTITPTGVIIPGNNQTSSITFMFNNPYKNLVGTTPGVPSIVINLSTPGCETYSIHQP